MRKLSVLLGTGLSLLVMAAPANALTQWDQRNDGPTGTSDWNVSSASQDFTPALAALDRVELCIGGNGAQVAVKIVDPETGEVLGTSGVATLPPGNDFFAFPHFLTSFKFDAPVELEPGRTYTIETVSVAGIAFAAFTADLDNLPNTTDDLWFREGLDGIDATAAPTSYVAAPTCI